MDHFIKEMIGKLLKEYDTDIERVLANLVIAEYEDEDVDLQNVIDYIKEEQDERN